MQKGKRSFKVPFTYTNGAKGTIDPLSIPDKDWTVHHGVGFDGVTKVNSPRTYILPGTEMSLVDFGNGKPILSIPDADLQVLSAAVMATKDVPLD
ncbi:hypothetical protein IIB50_02920 [Patescibacteria group bacterium]|nr:hypothetical protein [Patescibacteria group bacterium]